MGNEEFFKKVYLSNVEGTNRRGRPLVRWEDRVKEYMNERGVRRNGLEWARREHMVEVRLLWPSPWGDASGGSEASELLID